MLTNLAGLGMSAHTLAASPPPLATPPGLSFAEIKITGSEFIMLQNNTGVVITDLSKYWLYAFNNVNPVAPGVSSSSQQLPAAVLGSGQTVLLSANGGATCGAAITAKLSLSLNDSSGYLEVVQTALNNGVLTQAAGDTVSWSSTTNSTAGMISNAPSNSAAPNGAYYRYQNSSSPPPYLWQQADLDPNNGCQMNVTIAGKPVPGPSSPGNALLPGTPPPATIIEAGDDAQTNVSGMPAADIGLMAPQVNEILPNPAEPQTDSEDEYIELYNSNGVTFDLSGFKLQVGTSATHTYTFPAGTGLPAQAFVAFNSIDTGLSLSNSGGQARLLDPAGNLITQTDVYDNAKDGQSWALANGKWYWTTSLTPNAANEIRQPLTITSLSTGSTGSSKPAPAAPKVKAASTTAAKKTTAKTTTAAASTPSGNSSGASGKSHWPILAGIGAVALLYALYEYRHDLGNYIYRFRRYREARGATRETA